MISLDQFIAKYQGKKGIGTGAGDNGECGGIYNVGTQEMWDLKYPIRDVVNMGDLLQGRNINPDKVQIIMNNPKDPSQIPQRGDAVVFKPGPTGDSRGHVIWCTAAGLKQVSGFDQSQGIACAVRNYNYTNTKGWIHYKTNEGEEMFKGKTAEEWYKESSFWKGEDYKKAKELNRLSVKVASLQAQVGNSTKWETLKSLLKELFN